MEVEEKQKQLSCVSKVVCYVLCACSPLAHSVPWMDGDDVNDGDRGIILKFPWPYLFDVLVVPFDLEIG